jgi:hypothetical protein
MINRPHSSVGNFNTGQIKGDESDKWVYAAEMSWKLERYKGRKRMVVEVFF